MFDIPQSNNELLQMQDFFARLVSELPAETQSFVKREINRRKELIDGLLHKYDNHKDQIFFHIFGKELKTPTRVTMHVFPFGIYFSGTDPVFENIVGIDAGGFLGPLGMAFTRNSEEFFVDQSFYKMVGFGSINSLEHELQHLFNSMLPYNIAYDYDSAAAGSHLDLEEATRERLTETYHNLFRLRFNVHMRDEVAARINNHQIDTIHPEPEGNVWSSSDHLFTTYGAQIPSLVTEFSLRSRERQMLTSEKKEQLEQAEELDYSVLTLVREQYRTMYNLILTDIQAAIRAGVPRSKITAKIISCLDFRNFRIGSEQ